MATPAAPPVEHPAPGNPAPARPAYGAVSLRYLETSPIRVRGSASGREYIFSAASPVQAVAAQDAAALLATRFFRRG